MKQIFLAISLTLFSTTIFAGHPDCSGTKQWATTSAFRYLKNANMTSDQKIDHDKTRTKRLASQKINETLYRQIHHVVFTEKTGKTIQVITSNIVANKACSKSFIDAYVISKHLRNKQ